MPRGRQPEGVLSNIGKDTNCFGLEQGWRQIGESLVLVWIFDINITI